MCFNIYNKEKKSNLPTLLCITFVYELTQVAFPKSNKNYYDEVI